MGCDIHVHVEVKFYDDWLYYNHPEIERWYALFELLAGVRGSKQPVVPVKGLPDDLTPMTVIHLERERDNSHTFTYFTVDDIKKVEKEAKLTLDIDFDERFGYLFGNSFTEFEMYPDSYPEGLTDVRIIFWFDN